MPAPVPAPALSRHFLRRLHQDLPFPVAGVIVDRIVDEAFRSGVTLLNVFAGIGKQRDESLSARWRGAQHLERDRMGRERPAPCRSR
jgi:hypothetical protein